MIDIATIYAIEKEKKMDEKTKYIVINHFVSGKTMYIFPEYIQRKYMSRVLLRNPNDEIYSAGYINNGECYGKSISLDIDSNPEIDNELLKKLIG